MEFWGVEVKAGKSLHVTPDNGDLIHISQVSLGEVKNPKSANSILVRMEVDGKELVIGTLSVDKVPQIMFDLVLEKDFTLSHGWKDGSLYFCGYTAAADQEAGEGPYGNDSSDEDESENEEITEKGKPVADVEAAVPAKAKAATKPGTSAKPELTLVDPKKEDSDDSEGSDEDSDDESDDEDLDDDSDDDTSEDEETPKKVESSKKRPSSSEIKTPASTKKAKTETPQKTVPTSADGKKGAHIATPHPAKKSVKKTAETPKSSAQILCNSCSKTFTSEKGLESHSKAKHGGK